MKNLIVKLFLISSILTKHSEYVLIEHIGVSDKPIASIIICQGNKIKSSEGDIFNVNEKTYVLLKTAFLSYKKSSYNGVEFGSFKITISNINGMSLSYCLNRKQSNELFLKLIRILSENNPSKDLLLSRLIVQERRIE